MPKCTIEKVEEIIILCKGKGELNTQDVMDNFGVSNRVAIDYMRRAAGNGLIFYKGYAANPSKLVVVGEQNKLDVIAYSVIEEMRLQGRGATKRIRSILIQYKLDESELKQVIPKIVKLSGQKISLADPNDSSKPLIHRRLLYRGGL